MSHSDSENHGLFLPSKASKERWDCVQFWKFFLSFSFFLPKKFSEAANAYYLSRLICAESEISKLVRFLINYYWFSQMAFAVKGGKSQIFFNYERLFQYTSLLFILMPFCVWFYHLYYRKRLLRKGLCHFQQNNSAWLLPPEERCLRLPNYLNIWYALIN